MKPSKNDSQKDNDTIDINDKAEKIDALLPQTQCTLCGYNGCMPYAKAIANGEATLDLCLPGGIRVLNKLGRLLKNDVLALEDDLKQRSKMPAVAVIDEDDCIGCTKCIQACPVDAIVGMGKKMHRIITKDCTGCELCIAPCPVDCISLVADDNQRPSEQMQVTAAQRAREIYLRREDRLAKERLEVKERHQKMLNAHTNTTRQDERIEQAKKLQQEQHEKGESENFNEKNTENENHSRQQTVTYRQSMIANALIATRKKKQLTAKMRIDKKSTEK